MCTEFPELQKKRTNFSTFLVKIENKYEPSKCEIGTFYRGNESQPYSHWMSIPHEFTHIKCSRVIIYFGIWTVRKWVDFDVNAKQNPIPYRIYSPSFCLFVSWHVGANVTTQSYTRTQYAYKRYRSSCLSLKAYAFARVFFYFLSGLRLGFCLYFHTATGDIFPVKLQSW